MAKRQSATARNIYAIRNHYGYNQTDFGEKVGVSQVTVSNWETSGHDVSQDSIQKIMDAFPVTYDDIKSDENGFAKKVNQESHKKLPVQGMKMSPVPLRRRVHAGPVTDPDDLSGLGETVDVPDFLLAADKDCYACEVEGDCMNKVYPTGCVIVVSPNKPPQNGSVAVVDIEGIGTVMRRMYRTANTLVLSPDSFNSEHKDIVITSDDDRTVVFGGKVVWFQSIEEME